MSIELHSTLGVNPHLTTCPRCAGDGDEIILIGRRTAIMRCNNCELVIYGHRQSEPCPRCLVKRKFYGDRDRFTEIGRIEEHDRLPATQPCKKCRDEMATMNAEIAAGGVFFRCRQCKTEGVIKASKPLAALVREQTKIAPPDPVGVVLDDCPRCAGL